MEHEKHVAGAFDKWREAVAQEGATGRYTPPASSSDPFSLASKILIGGDEAAMNRVGRQDYPNVPPGSAHHAATSEAAAARYGMLPTQLGGLIVEYLENKAGANKSQAGRRDTKMDVLANLGGGFVGTLPGPTRFMARPAVDQLIGLLRNTR